MIQKPKKREPSYLALGLMLLILPAVHSCGKPVSQEQVPIEGGEIGRADSGPGDAADESDPGASPSPGLAEGEGAEDNPDEGIVPPGGEGGPIDPAVAPDPSATPLTNPYAPLPPQGAFSGDKNFGRLINEFQQAKPDNVPWAGYWWPYTKNGIASGTGGRGSSPAGKYDAARGNRTNAQSWEAANHGARVRGVQGWWGHCNGWSAAAALFPEPREDKIVNGINFGVSDIKGLLTEACMEVQADFYGNRVDWGNDFNNGKYEDVIPNQFFLLLTNFMGKQKLPVLIDRHTGHEVWNQPMTGYRFEYPKPEDYLGADSAAPNIYRLMLTAKIWWADDGVDPGILSPTFNFQDQYPYDSRTLKMELWLDGPVVFDPSGKVTSSGDLVVTRDGEKSIGGKWRNGDGFYSDHHPDYMWIPYTVLKPTDYANKEVDIDWVTKYVLTGTDDPSSPAGNIRPAPSVQPSEAPNPWNTPRPTNTPTTRPNPVPTTTVIPGPGPQPQPLPTIPTPPRPNPQPTTPIGGGPPRPFP